MPQYKHYANKGDRFAAISYTTLKYGRGLVLLVLFLFVYGKLMNSIWAIIELNVVFQPVALLLLEIEESNGQLH